MFESTKIIAHKQYYKARELFMDDDNQIQLRGPVKFVHEYIDMTKQVMPAYRSAIELSRRASSSPSSRSRRSELAKATANGTLETCDAALGYSFAAGTTDGPGAFDFQQGDTISTRYWNMMRDFLRRPSDKQIKCHHPKPILLSTGEMDFPYMWHPRVVATQLFMIGQLAIVGLPGEFTTMSGRRVREAVHRTLYDAATRGTSTPSSVFTCDELDDDDDDVVGDDNHQESNQDMLVRERDDETSACRNSRRQEMSLPGDSGQLLRRHKRAYSLAPEIRVVLSGLSNVYTSYVATIEEYEVQRYEGASTLYGPHTLQAYVRQFKRLSRLIMGDSGEQPVSDLKPPDLSKSLFTLRAGVIYDGTQNGRNFGDLLQDVNASSVYRCNDTVVVSFVAANPRNDLRQEGSFIYIERYQRQQSTGASNLKQPADESKWQVIATDASWETKFIWERTNTIFGESKATVVWEIPSDCRPGVYRIRHVGAHKNLFQSISPYSGKSTPFRVLANNAEWPQVPASASELDELLEEALVSAALEQTVKTDSPDTNQPAATPTFYSSAVGVISSLLGFRPARH